MIIYVDIDNTITRTNGADYENAIPIPERIDRMNKLYDDGHRIIYWTARGTITGIDWKDLTLHQLKYWNVKYHELKMNKPAYDLFIDDRNIHSDAFFNYE